MDLLNQINYPAKMQNDPYSRIVLFVFFVLLAALWSAAPVHAAAQLTISAYGTWDVIGLDSNKVTTGPDHFPVGIEVCNTGDAAATNLVSDFHFTDANDPFTGDPYINLHPGSVQQETLPSIAAGDCGHFYFEVQITRSPLAYNKTRGYYITVTSNETGQISTPTPRQLYVEYLISQNRNSVSDVQLDGVSIPVSGTMQVVVGGIYQIKVIGSTATQGYNQLESFINLPNSVFRILDIQTTYSANTSTPVLVPTPNPSLYANACGWDPVPTSPTYRNCIVDSLWKAGGNSVITTYTVLIVGGGGATETLNTILYDFSGSSYHYNSDFDAGVRYAAVVDPTQFTIDKSFTPDSIYENGTSTVSFTLHNPYDQVFSGFNFTDTLPTHLTVANPANVTTGGCGTPNVGATPEQDVITFTNGTIAPLSDCVISVDVQADAATGMWTNTTTNLFINDVDTGDNATANLAVSGTPPAPAACTGAVMAKWTFDGFTSNPPPFPHANVQSANVPTAEITTGGNVTLTAEPDAADGNPLPSMLTYGWNNGAIVPNTSPYIQFMVDGINYTGINFAFDALADPNGPTSIRFYTSTDGTNFSLVTPDTAVTTSWAHYTPSLNLKPNSANYVRMYTTGANNANKGSDLNFDNVSFTGSGDCAPASMTKDFSPDPIAVNAVSTLTFTLTNPNDSDPLTNATFTDNLPLGLRVANSPAASTTCGGTPTWNPSFNDVILNFSGGTILAGSSCTVQVDIEATTSGPHLNVSGYLTTDEGGTNTKNTAVSTLTAIDPPTIAKTFLPNPILAGGTSSLIINVTNPNPNNAISGVKFTDALPASPAQMTALASPAPSYSGCGAGTLGTVNNGDTTLSFTGGSIAADSICTITVTVTAPGIGTYVNTTGAVQHQLNGVDYGTETATGNLVVTPPTPALALTKQISASASGPWSTYISSTVTAQVYYRFVLENAGDVPLDTLEVVDPILTAMGFDPSTQCTWNPSTLPVADVNTEATSECISGAISISASGLLTNTAVASALDPDTESTVNARQSKATFLGVSPTAVNVTGVRARLNAKNNAVVRWRTISEAQITGFNMYRQAGNGEWKQINTDLRQVKNPGTALSNKYRFTDRSAASGKTYRYKIQVIYLDNHTEWTDAVRLKIP